MALIATALEIYSFHALAGVMLSVEMFDRQFILPAAILVHPGANE